MSAQARKRVSPHVRRLRSEPLEARQMLTITVDTLVDEADGSIDDGDISLRDAIALAPSGETIDFAVAGTILLELGELSIDKDLTLNGPGAELLSIDGGGVEVLPDGSIIRGSRVFNVDDGDDLHHVQVSISRLTITGSYAEGDGGGVLSRESLSIDNAVLSGNAIYGGRPNGTGIAAIVPSGATLDINATSITDNFGGFGTRGAGVYLKVSPDGTANIRHGTISGNNSFFGRAIGGGIYAINDGGLISIVDIDISRNDDGISPGAGIYASNTNGGRLNIIDSSITDHVIGYAGDPGGIRVRTEYDAVTTISGSRILRNAGTGIEAISRYGGRTIITDSTISENTWHGIEADSRDGGDLLIADSVISQNAFGGATTQGPTAVLNTTIVDNMGLGLSLRGGIRYSATKLPLLFVSGSTIAGNIHQRHGGGLRAAVGSGEVQIFNTTVSGNFPVEADIVLADSARARLSHITITNNFHGTSGGSTLTGTGLRFRGPDGSVSIDHSIIAGDYQVGGMPVDIYDNGGMSLDPLSYHNLIGVDTGFTGISNGTNGNIIGTIAMPFDPLLSPLQDNGGPTLTHALLPGSPAIDAGDPAAVAGMDGVPGFDQRGAPYSRVLGAAIDVGAFEVQSQPTVEELLQQYVDEGVLKRGQANSLAVKLATHGNRPPKPKRILPFINHVDAFVRAGILTREQGDALIDAATQPPPVEPNVVREAVFAASPLLDDAMSDEPGLEFSPLRGPPRDLAIDAVLEGFAAKKNPRHRRR